VSKFKNDAQNILILDQEIMQQIMHEDLLDYFRKHEQHLEHFLALCIEETEPESVHQLRVSIKRLKTVLQLTGQLSGNETDIVAAKIKPLRKLFKIAGCLRDVQVQQKLIPEYEAALNLDFERYRKFLDKLEKQFVKKFTSFIGKSKPIHRLNAGREWIEKSLSVLTPDEIRDGAEQLLASRCSTVKQILAQKPDDEKLHKIRILIKQMRYILSIMRRNNPDYPEKIVKLADLNEPEILLGKWHDIVVGIAYLKDFIEKNDIQKTSDITDYASLAKMLSSERIKLRKQIIKSFGKSFCA
jgi:CHAD domain-containing protein